MAGIKLLQFDASAACLAIDHTCMDGTQILSANIGGSMHRSAGPRLSYVDDISLSLLPRPTRYPMYLAFRCSLSMVHTRGVATKITRDVPGRTNIAEDLPSVGSGLYFGCHIAIEFGELRKESFGRR